MQRKNGKGMWGDEGEIARLSSSSEVREDPEKREKGGEASIEKKSKKAGRRNCRWSIARKEKLLEFGSGMGRREAEKRGRRGRGKENKEKDSRRNLRRLGSVKKTKRGFDLWGRKGGKREQKTQGAGLPVKHKRGTTD